MFTCDSKTEHYLRAMGVQFEYCEEVAFDEFAEAWYTVNRGRPGSMALVQDAITTYAEMMLSGSAAPAVILRRVGGRYEVLDGIQRSRAALQAGFTYCAAYIVRCTENTATKIRMAANLRLQGAAPVDAEWAICTLVEHFMINGNDSAQDIAMACGRTGAEVEKVYRRLKVRNEISALFDGKTAPHLKAAVYDEIAKVSDAKDFSEGGDAVRQFVGVLDKCKFANGEAIEHVRHFFGIKRRGSVSRDTSLKSKLREIKQHPIVARKLSGNGKKLEDVENVNSRLRALETVVRDYVKKDCDLDDLDIVRAWDASWHEIGRLLRQKCSTKVRRNLDPFSLQPVAK